MTDLEPGGPPAEQPKPERKRSPSLKPSGGVGEGCAESAPEGGDSPESVGDSLPAVPRRGLAREIALASDVSSIPSVMEEGVFDVRAVPVGLPVVRDFGVAAPGIAEAAGQIPPAVLSQAELYWTTGMGTSCEHIRVLVHHAMGVDVPERVLQWHFSENWERLDGRRREYMQRRFDKAMEQQLEISSNPVDARAQAMALGMGAILEGMLGEVLHGQRTVDVKGLREMARAAKDIGDIDPEARKGAVEMAGRVAAAQAGGLMAGFQDGYDRVQKYRRESEEADALVAEYEQHTDRVLDVEVKDADDSE